MLIEVSMYAKNNLEIYLVMGRQAEHIQYHVLWKGKVAREGRLLLKKDASHLLSKPVF